MRTLVLLFIIVGLAGCSQRSPFTPTLPHALEVGTAVPIFTGTSRARDSQGRYGIERSEQLNYLEAVVSVPPSHQAGRLNFGYDNPDPRTQFTMASRAQFDSRSAFRANIRAELRKRPPDQRDVTVFVHGYNYSQSEAVFRAAQLTTDLDLQGVSTAYSWPSRGNALGYVYDHDSALFARDGLETMLRDLAEVAPGRVIILAHSMGGFVTMETIRQIELQTPGWSERNIGGMVLISPDLNVDLFSKQVMRIEKLPQPFVVFVSGRDPALGLSAKLSGSRDRLGNIQNIDAVKDLPIQIIDTTALSKTAESGHFIPATSPTMIAMLRNASSLNRSVTTSNKALRLTLNGVVDNDQTATRVVLNVPSGHR